MPVKTVTCKLRVDREKRAALDATFDLFNAVCNHLSRIAWESKNFRPFALHKAAYHITRAEFGLTAQVERGRERRAQSQGTGRTVRRPNVSGRSPVERRLSCPRDKPRHF